jgi:hypothetical protein
VKFAQKKAKEVRKRSTTTQNLLVNGDAEAHRCTNDWTTQTSVPGWEVIRGAASILCYSAFRWTNETVHLVPQIAGGKSLFAAPGIDTALRQTVHVESAAESIDSNMVDFHLSGWLGGWRNRPERAVVTLIFLDTNGDATGEPVVISAMTRAYNKLNALYECRRSGPIPPQTRRILVTLDLPGSIGGYHNSYADNLRLTLSGPYKNTKVATAALTIPPSTVPPIDRLFVVMMENTNYNDVIDIPTSKVSPIMPYLASLASKGVTLTNIWGTYHPSDQNYIAMVAGDTYKIGPVYFPDYDLHVSHIGDLLEAKNLTWKAYAQTAKRSCNLNDDSPPFFPDDEPFVQFSDVISDPVRCNNTIRDLSDLFVDVAAGTLPNYAWIAADDYYEGEGAWYLQYNVTFANIIQDRFLKFALEPFLTSKQWLTSRSVLMITWDESGGWGWPDNHVPTFLIGSQPGLIHNGKVINTHYNGYDLLRTAEEALRLPSFGRFDLYAKPLNDVFVAPAGETISESKGLLLSGTPTSATRGHIYDTFARVTTPVAADHGEPLELTVVGADVVKEVEVVLTRLGETPTVHSKRYSVRTNGEVLKIPTGDLLIGLYAAWLMEGPKKLPAQAALPVTIVPRGLVKPNNPGVEIWSSLHASITATYEVRQSGNVFVHYCRPSHASANITWIGIFDKNTTKLSKSTVASGAVWNYAPGNSPSDPCGYTWTQTQTLNPGIYRFVMVVEGVNTPVGLTATFSITPVLPA